MTLLQAEFWKCDGNHHGGGDCERYDPHGLGLEVISMMAYLVDSGFQSVEDVALTGVVVRHKDGDGFGHGVHIAATREQWSAVAVFAAKDRLRLV